LKRLNQLAFPRFAASLMIVLFHYGGGYYPFNVEPWSRMVKDGPTLVVFFFVLSGFVLTLGYAKRDSGKVTWLPFIVRRLARFYPLYLVAVLAMVPFRFGEGVHTLRGLAIGLTLLQTWVPKYALAFQEPAWAMSVMFAFYILFPLVLPWFVRRGLRVSGIVIVSFWVISQEVIHYLYASTAMGVLNFGANFLFYSPLMHLNAFLLGIFGGQLYLDRSEKNLQPPKSNSLWLVVTFLLYVGFIFFRDDIPRLPGMGWIFETGLLAPLFLAMIYFLARDTGAISRFLSHKWLVTLGDISFTVYLLQSPVVQVYQTYLLDRLEHHIPWTAEIHFYLYLILLLGAAYLVHLLYEKPARKLTIQAYGWLEKKLVAERNLPSEI